MRTVRGIIQRLFHIGDVSGRSHEEPPKTVSQRAHEQLERSMARHDVACVNHAATQSDLLAAIVGHRLSQQELDSCIKACGHSCPNITCPLHDYAQQQPREHNDNCVLLMEHRRKTRDLEKAAELARIGVAHAG